MLHNPAETVFLMFAAVVAVPLAFWIIGLVWSWHRRRKETPDERTTRRKREARDAWLYRSDKRR